MATITRAIPFFSSLNADESITAMFAGAAAAGLVCGAAVAGVVGLVCVWARIAKVARAVTATIVRNTFIALLLDSVPYSSGPIAARTFRPCQSSKDRRELARCDWRRG